MTKILLIEDDPTTITVLTTILEREETFELTVENSGDKALEAVRRVEPDVILLDLMMPGLSGWQVCRAIRAFSQTPILILSAVIDPERVMQALDAGANDYLVKPPPIGVLISRLKDLAQGS